MTKQAEDSKSTHMLRINMLYQLLASILLCYSAVAQPYESPLPSLEKIPFSRHQLIARGRLLFGPWSTYEISLPTQNVTKSQGLQAQQAFALYSSEIEMLQTLRTLGFGSRSDPKTLPDKVLNAAHVYLNYKSIPHSLIVHKRSAPFRFYHFEMNRSLRILPHDHSELGQLATDFEKTGGALLLDPNLAVQGAEAGYIGGVSAELSPIPPGGAFSEVFFLSDQHILFLSVNDETGRHELGHRKRTLASFRGHLTPLQTMISMLLPSTPNLIRSKYLQSSKESEYEDDSILAAGLYAFDELESYSDEFFRHLARLIKHLPVLSDEQIILALQKLQPPAYRARIASGVGRTYAEVVLERLAQGASSFRLRKGGRGIFVLADAYFPIRWKDAQTGRSEFRLFMAHVPFFRAWIGELGDRTTLNNRIKYTFQLLNQASREQFELFARFDGLNLHQQPINRDELPGILTSFLPPAWPWESSSQAERCRLEFWTDE